jgi:L-ascorbate metabolism protein UlaG (beta-lactamase superfamily)
MSLIPAIKKDKELIAEMDSLLKDESSLYIWWLGQSGFLLQHNSKRVLFDPYLSDSLTKKYLTTDKPHTRMSELVVDPNLLKNINVVTSSHNHTDQPLLQNNLNIKFVIPKANRNFIAERVGCDINFPIGLNQHSSLNIDGIEFIGVPAKHNEIDKDDNGNCKYMGFVIKFGNYIIYHSGDTLWFDELIEILKPHNVDIALLPINGNKPERKVAGNLDCKEAATLAKKINAKMVVPCHYNMFTFNTANVNDFVKECEQLNQPYKILNGGGFLKY